MVDVNNSDDPEGLQTFYYLVQDLKVRHHIGILIKGARRRSKNPETDPSALRSGLLLRPARSLSTRSSRSISRSSRCVFLPSALFLLLRTSFDSIRTAPVSSRSAMKVPPVRRGTDDLRGVPLCRHTKT